MYHEYEYEIGEVSLLGIRNRNETRVVKAMTEILPEYTEFNPSRIDIEDVYCLALNNLAARYTPVVSMVLREPVTDKDIEKAVRDAIDIVGKRPNHS